MQAAAVWAPHTTFCKQHSEAGLKARVLGSDHSTKEPESVLCGCGSALDGKPLSFSLSIQDADKNSAKLSHDLAMMRTRAGGEAPPLNRHAFRSPRGS